MTEITQVDREVAAAFYGTWGGTNGWQHLSEPIRDGDVDDNSLVQAFARHRLEERAAIVAWLRKLPASERVRLVQESTELLWSTIYADAIDRGDHLE